MQHTIYKANLNNNCPKCFNTEGLELTFFQEIISAKFYSKAKKEITSTLYCNTCNTKIFPVSWTEDIERVHKYHYKLTKPISTKLKLKIFK